MLARKAQLARFAGLGAVWGGEIQGVEAKRQAEGLPSSGMPFRGRWTAAEGSPLAVPCLAGVC